MDKHYKKYIKILVEMKTVLEKKWEHLYESIEGDGRRTPSHETVMSVIANYVSVCHSLDTTSHHFHLGEVDDYETLEVVE